jgi:phosphoacetylglucosamine mutase
MESHDEAILAASARHPIVPLEKGRFYAYGTAGFRMKADLLEGITFRVGLLAALRSRKLNGQAIGVMITASHNPAVDNGVKVVDPLGDMLEQDWERYATALVNAPSDEQLVEVYNRLAADLKIDIKAPAKVIYGRDTRPSGHKLATALADGLASTNAEHVDYKILTTPQLHYLVRATNSEGTPLSYGKVSELGYYEKMAKAFVRAMKGRKLAGTLSVDCANGVGGPKLNEFLKHIPREKVGLDIKVVNDDVLRPEVLNLDVRTLGSFCFGYANMLSVRCRFCQDEAEGSSHPQAPTRHKMLLPGWRCGPADLLLGRPGGWLCHAGR